MSQHTSKDNNAVISEGGEYSVSYYGAFKIWRGNELIGEFLVSIGSLERHVDYLRHQGSSLWSPSSGTVPLAQLHERDLVLAKVVSHVSSSVGLQ